MSRRHAPLGKPWYERGAIGRIWRWLEHELWQLELASHSKLAWGFVRAARLGMIAARGFFEKRCAMQAMALTYITVFSLPPMLAFAFSAAKGFNAYTTLKERAIDPFLDRTFGLRGQAATEGIAQMRSAIDQIFAFVEQTPVGALAGVSLVVTLYAVIKLLGAIERSFNDVWGVRRARTLVRKFTDYVAIAFVTPLFLVLATGVTILLQSERVQGSLGGWAQTFAPLLALLPILAVWCGLSFLYVALPNTRVPIVSALIGGGVASFLWQVSQVVYIQFQIGVAKFNAIYASFAAIPMLLAWFYLSWVIVLIGAQVAYAHQNEAPQTAIRRTGSIDQAYREALAPRLAGRIARAFLAGESAPSAAALASELGAPPHVVQEVLDLLVEHDLIAATSSGAFEGYLPARDPDTISVIDLLVALRRDRDSRSPPVKDKLDERVDRALAELESQGRASIANHTLRELALCQGPTESQRSAGREETEALIPESS